PLRAGSTTGPHGLAHGGQRPRRPAVCSPRAARCAPADRLRDLRLLPVDGRRPAAERDAPRYRHRCRGRNRSRRPRFHDLRLSVALLHVHDALRSPWSALQRHGFNRRPDSAAIVTRRHTTGRWGLEEIDAPAHGRGKVTLRAVLRGLAVELGELREAIRLTPVWLWLRFGVVALALSCLGLLPLGAWTLPVQALSFALIACVVVWPESVARVLRSSDAFGVRERDSSRVATYLPVAVAVFGLPFYLCAQA